MGTDRTADEVIAELKEARNDLIAAGSKVRYSEDAKWLYRAADRLAALVDLVSRQPEQEQACSRCGEKHHYSIPCNSEAGR